MNRGQRSFSITVGLAVLVVTGGYFLTRPTWRTATEAEIRAQIHPDLLTLPEEMPEARERYDRLMTIVGQIPLGNPAELPSAKATKNLLTTTPSQFTALEKLIQEGPLQAPLKSSERTDNEKLTLLVRELTIAASQEVGEGRPNSAARLLLLGVRLHQRLSETAATMSDFLSGAARVGLLVRGFHAVPVFPEAELAKFAKEMPPAPDHDPALLNALRDDLRTGYIPRLADPRGERIPDFNDKRPVMGNYDALESARDLNRALIPWLTNAKVPRSEQDLSGDTSLRILEQSLPTINRSGRNELARRFAEWRFSWAMARVTNSYGRRLLVAMTNGGFQAVADTSFRRRSCWEGIRTTIALRRYRLAKGAPAPNLQALVDAGYLSELPFDHLGTGPLMYDPTRSVLWSVGTDGKDDGGTALPGMIGQSDIVWQTS